LQDETLGLSLTDQCRIFSLIALHGCLYSGWFSVEDCIRKVQLERAFSGMGQGFWAQLLEQVGNDTEGQITLQDGNKIDSLALSDIVIKQHQQVVANKTPIIFFVGLPGAGKSSFRNRYAGYKVLSRDDVLHEVTATSHYRQAWERQESEQLAPIIDQLLMDRYMKAVQEQQPIVMDLTNLSRKTRQRWLSLLPGDYSPQALIFLASDITLWQRNYQRGDRSIPDAVFKQMLLSFEHPLFDEFEQISYVVDAKIVHIG
jgi:predicted kinase